MNRTWPMIDIAVFFAIVYADSIGLVPISQTVFLIPFIWLVLRIRSERWATIGFNLPGTMLKYIGLGVVAGVLMELFAIYLTTPWISGGFGVEPDYSELSEVQGNVQLLVLYLVLSWVLAAFGEEICFRGFLMKRIAQLFGESQWAWVLSLVLASVLFGWGHTEQGISGWIQEGISGFLLGVLFLVARKNLVLPIVAHGVSNSLAFTLIYLGNYPGLGASGA